jgi:hypothetical protein
MPITRFIDSGHAVSDDDISRVEQRFECRLPVAYKLFLQRQNGGQPKPDAFHGLRPRDGALVDFFYVIDGDETMDLIENGVFLRDYHDVPATMIPIAATTSGDVICLGIEAATNYGKIYFWSHDAPVRAKSTWLLAHDLDSFLSTFHEIDLDELTMGTAAT